MTGVSHFILSWCITRHVLRRSKLLRQYGCGLDLSDFNIGFQCLTHPSKLNTFPKVHFMSNASPHKIKEKMQTMDADATLVVLHATSWTGWDLSIPAEPECRILSRMIGLPLFPRLNVAHVRCGDTVSFGFEVNKELSNVDDDVLRRICDRLRAEYSDYVVITDCDKLDELLHGETKEKTTHSMYLQHSQKLISDISTLIRAKDLINISNYDAPSCFSFLFSRLSQSKYTPIYIHDFIS